MREAFHFDLNNVAKSVKQLLKGNTVMGKGARILDLTVTYIYNFQRHKTRDRVSSVGIVSRLRSGRSGVGIPVGARDFYLLQNVQTYSVGTGVLSLGYSGRGVKLTTHSFCSLSYDRSVASTKARSPVTAI
jgi:hypothetical protein